MTTRTMIVYDWHTMADGTKKRYQKRKKYVVKSHTQEDGSVFKLSPEEIEKIKAKHAEGVSIKRLEQDFKCSYPTIKKALDK